MEIEEVSAEAVKAPGLVLQAVILISRSRNPLGNRADCSQSPDESSTWKLRAPPGSFVLDLRLDVEGSASRAS